MSPVWGLISVPSSMQCLAQASMQRPQPLQYSGSRKGLGFSAVVGMRGSPFGVQTVQTPRQDARAIHQWHRRHDDADPTASLAHPAENRRKICTINDLEGGLV